MAGFLTIARFIGRSGLPSSIFYGGVYPTNFSFGAVAYPISSYSFGTKEYDQKGNPNAFSSTTEAGATGCLCMQEPWEPAPQSEPPAS